MQIKFITQFLFQCICSFVHIHELYYCLLKIDITHVDVNLKPRFLIENVYYIVPSPSTSLINTYFLMYSFVVESKLVKLLLHENETTIQEITEILWLQGVHQQESWCILIIKIVG